MAEEATKLNEHELELQSSDTDNYPIIKMRGNLIWNGAAWEKWDGVVDVDLGTNDGVHAEDSAHTTGDEGMFALAVRNDVLAAIATTDGDYAPLQVNASGALYVRDNDANTLLGTIDADTSTLAGAVTGTEMQVDVVDEGDLVRQSTTVTVYNVTMTSADTEYSQALPAGTKKFTWQCRTAFDVRFAYVTGKVATPTAPYVTLKSGTSYWEDNANLTSKTLYIACADAGKIVELICWT